LAKKLLRFITPDTCPQGHFTIHQELLEGARAGSDEFVHHLESCAVACARLPQPDKLLKQLQYKLKRARLAPLTRAFVLGCMAEAVFGSPVGNQLLREHKQHRDRAVRKKKDASAIHQLRQRLAQAGACRVLADALIEDAVTHAGFGAGRFTTWDKSILEPFPQVFHQVCSELVHRIQEPASTDQLLSLAQKLLVSASSRADEIDNREPVHLVETVINRLPVCPLDPKWDGALRSFEPKLSKQTTVRLKLLSFLRQLQHSAREPDWNATRFPHTEAAWSDARELPGPTRRQACDWVLDTFRTVGITNEQEVQAFQNILQAIGMESAVEFAEALVRSIDKRDHLAAALAIRAVVRHALSRCNPKSEPRRQSGQNLAFSRDKPPLRNDEFRFWVNAIQRIRTQTDRATWKLVEYHLMGWFSSPDASFRDSLFRLCHHLHIPVPKEHRVAGYGGILGKIRQVVDVGLGFIGPGRDRDRRDDI
jgi:hypothetical protein